MSKTQKETSSSLKLMVKTSFFIFFTVVLSKLFSYFYKFVIARNFGPEIYGTFSLALIILGIFASIALLGFPEGFIRFVSFYMGKDEKKKAKYIISFTTIILIITSITASIIIFFSAGIFADIFNNQALIPFLRVLAFSLPFSTVFIILVSYLRAIGKINSFAILSNPVQNGLKLAVLISLIALGIGEKSVIFSQTIAMILLATIAFFVAKNSFTLLLNKKELKQTEKKEIQRELITYSWPLVFAGLLYGLFYWTDSLVLGYFTDASVVGFYNAAVTLISLFAIAQDLFIQLFFPLLSRKYAEKKYDVIRDTTKQVIKWVYMINILIFAALVLFPGVIINIFFGPSYLSAQSVLRILAFGAILSGFLGMFITLLSIKGKTKLVLVNYIIFTLINLTLDIILVKMYGMNGAAIATSFTWGLFTLLVVLQIKKEYGFFPVRKEMIKITAIAAILVSLAYLIQDKLIPTTFTIIIFGIVFFICYITILFLAKCFDKQDLEIIMSIKNRVMTYTNIKKTK